MADGIRFGWIGETRRIALRSLLAGLLEDWARAWWLEYADGLITVAVIDEPTRTQRRGLCWLCADEAGAAAVQLSGRDADALGRWLAATGGDENVQLAQRIGEDALADLMARVRQRAGNGKPPAPAKAALPVELEHARLGAFAVTATLGRIVLELVIDRRLADRLAPPAAAPPRELAPRQQALQHAPVQVAALMDFGAVDLAHLSDLSVGDVLVGDRRLDEPLRIHLEGYGAVATGFLRRLGEQRAVVLDGIDTQEGNNHE